MDPNKLTTEDTITVAKILAGPDPEPGVSARARKEGLYDTAPLVISGAETFSFSFFKSVQK